MGFSCEDLQYNPDYLEIRPALRQGASFHFLVRSGSTPLPPLLTLRDEFPANVQLHEGELPGWPFHLARQAGVEHPLAEPAPFIESQATQLRANALQRLRTALSQWAGALSRMEVFNATTTLFAAAGHRARADEILRRVWTSYRVPADCVGPAYARYLNNYGEALLRGASCQNPHDRTTDPAAWKAAADRDPSQFFFRSIELGGNVATAARLTLSKFLAGVRIPHLAGEVASLHRQLLADGAILSLTGVDAALSFAELLELCGLGRAATPWLERAHEASKQRGDELRRAEAAWRLARNLAYGVDEEAERSARILALTQESVDIAARLDIPQADAGSALAQAIAAIVRSDWQTAAEQAERAQAAYASVPDALGELYAARERMRALVGQGLVDGTLSSQAFDELNLFLQNFVINQTPGLRPLVKLELARLATYVDEQLARELAEDAAREGSDQGHPVVPKRALELLKQLSPPKLDA
jgi:hypothetical protein